MGLYTDKAWKLVKETLRQGTKEPCTEISITIGGNAAASKTTYGISLGEFLQKEGFVVLQRTEHKGKTLLYACISNKLIPYSKVSKGTEKD